MKHGSCPQCGSTAIYWTDNVSLFDQGKRIAAIGLGVRDLELYACVDCRYVEYYLLPQVDLDEIRGFWQFVGAVAPNTLPSADSAVTTIRLPPLTLDPARVIAYGPLAGRVQPTGRFQLRDSSGALISPAYVALVYYPQDTDIWRCYCDSHWTILQQTAFPSKARAIAALELEFEGAAKLLTPLAS